MHERGVALGKIKKGGAGGHGGGAGLPVLRSRLANNYEEVVSETMSWPLPTVLIGSKANPHIPNAGVGPNWKSRIALLVKRALNMSGCSHQSRAIVAALRTQLATALEERELTASHSAALTPSSYSSIVSCNNCGGFMVQPVCMPCGHSVCKACIEKSTMLSGDNLVCPKCSNTCPKIPTTISSSPDLRDRNAMHLERSADSELISKQYRTPTLTLQNAFCKWYPKWVESCQCREEGNKYANLGDFVLATRWYTQALETGTVKPLY